MTDAEGIRRCLELAARGAGRTAPNPMVGAVIEHEGRIIAEGWHVAPGRDHAEVDALRKLGGRAPGATVYVNLEPCCHHGRTPPCTDALLAAGVRRVVVGMVDPDPRVSGRGISILREAGVEVLVGVEAEAAAELNAGFVSRIRRGRPRVWMKSAISLDGRVADAFGASHWITGPEARAEVHRLRDRLDAVMVGSGTVLADDPQLNCRIEGGRDPLKVVLDSGLRTPAGARLLQGAPTLIFGADDVPDRAIAGATVLRVPRAGVGLDLRAVLAELGRRGVQDLLVEAGGRLGHGLLAADLVDRLLLFVAPKVLAGGPSFAEGAPFSLAAAPGFRLREPRQVGADALLVLDRVEPPPSA